MKMKCPVCGKVIEVKDIRTGRSKKPLLTMVPHEFRGTRVQCVGSRRQVTVMETAK